MHFIGRYYHALEQKGRLSIPKSFRNELGGQAIITRGLDGCIFLFHEKDWQSILTENDTTTFTKKNLRDWTRLLANNAQLVEFDRLGRILIPEYLRQQANVTKDTVIVGSVNRVEIWDQKTYHQYVENLENQAEDIAESISSKENNQ